MKTRLEITSPGSRRHLVTYLLAVSCLSLALAAQPGFAHEQRTAVTRILFNPNTGNIEIMHRFLVHDAEHAANLIFGERQTLMESAESRELFGSYVVNRFALEAAFVDGSSGELALDYVGEEIDGQFLWIYQEIEETKEIQSLTVANTALRDVWPDQANLVNIEKEGQIFSLSFVNSVEVLTSDLR